MVVRIERPTASSSAALAYNERKVEKGVASIVGFANLPSLDRKAIAEEFDRLERGRISASNISFHASVNPSDTDSCSEDQVLEFIREMMAGLHHADQPYVVYRHDDIGRPHYHVVSTRIAPDGRKINAWQDRVVVRELIRRLGPELGFELGRSSRVEQVDSLEEDVAGRAVPAHFHADGDVTSQMRCILEHCLTYNFTTESQFMMLMQDYGIGMYHGFADGRRQFMFQGMDREGKTLTPILSEGELGVDATTALAQALAAGRKSHRIRAREQSRVENIVRSFYGYSRSQQHLENMLRKADISMHISYSEAGEPFGLTFIDHRTRTAFKGSELHGALTVSMLREAVESGKWRESDRGQAKQRSHAKESREVSAMLRRAMSLGAVNLGGGASVGSAGQDPHQDPPHLNQDIADDNTADRNVADSNIASL